MAQELLELPLVGGAMTAKTVSDAISPSLVRFLMVEASDANDAVQRVALRPELITEAKAQNAVVQRLAAPVGIGGAMKALDPLMLMFDPPSFGKGREGDALADAWQSTYAKAISELPKEALDGAIQQWIKVGRFFPKPAELIAMADAKTRELRIVAWRMKKVAEESRAPRAPMTDAERLEMQAKMRELASDIRSGLSFKKGPPPQGPAKGDTPQMMAERIRQMAA